MGQTKTQKFSFTLMMCFGMVLGMTIYNMLLAEGFHSKFFLNLITDFWPGFFVALILDVFVIGKIAKPLAFKIVKPTEDTNPIKIIIAISSCMVFGMVICMSMFGAIHAVGFSMDAIKLYPLCFIRNIVVAFPLNLLVVSPLVRALFGKFVTT